MTTIGLLIAYPNDRNRPQRHVPWCTDYDVISDVSKAEAKLIFERNTGVHGSYALLPVGAPLTVEQVEALKAGEPDAEAKLVQERDAAYRGRAELIALLASIFPSQMHADADPNTPDWPVLYLDTPEGQLSWHINPADLDLFDTERYAAAEDDGARTEWDGHDNAEKSRRLRRLATCYVPEDFLSDEHDRQLRAAQARVASLEQQIAPLKAGEALPLDENAVGAARAAYVGDWELNTTFDQDMRRAISAYLQAIATTESETR